MKKTLAILTLILFVIACNKKALPVITARIPEPPAPAKTIIDVKPDMEIGKRVFTNRCGGCHDLPRPAQYTAQRWDGILSSMIPKAGLNGEQGIHVTAYLKANAAK